jgi:hypothetical protein
MTLRSFVTPGTSRPLHGVIFHNTCVTASKLARLALSNRLNIVGSFLTFDPITEMSPSSAVSCSIVVRQWARSSWSHSIGSGDGRSDRSQWPRGLRRGSAAARLLGLWVRILPGAWLSVSCDCCVLSGRGLCDELVNRPEESYRV